MPIDDDYDDIDDITKEREIESLCVCVCVCFDFILLDCCGIYDYSFAPHCSRISIAS